MVHPLDCNYFKKGGAQVHNKFGKLKILVWFVSECWTTWLVPCSGQLNRTIVLLLWQCHNILSNIFLDE